MNEIEGGRCPDLDFIRSITYWFCTATRNQGTDRIRVSMQRHTCLVQRRAYVGLQGLIVHRRKRKRFYPRLPSVQLTKVS